MIMMVAMLLMFYSCSSRYRHRVFPIATLRLHLQIWPLVPRNFPIHVHPFCLIPVGLQSVDILLKYIYRAHTATLQTLPESVVVLINVSLPSVRQLQTTANLRLALIETRIGDCGTLVTYVLLVTQYGPLVLGSFVPIE